MSLVKLWERAKQQTSVVRDANASNSSARHVSALHVARVKQSKLWQHHALSMRQGVTTVLTTSEIMQQLQLPDCTRTILSDFLGNVSFIESVWKHQSTIECSAKFDNSVSRDQVVSALVAAGSLEMSAWEWHSRQNTINEETCFFCVGTDSCCAHIHTVLTAIARVLVPTRKAVCQFCGFGHLKTPVVCCGKYTGHVLCLAMLLDGKTTADESATAHSTTCSTSCLVCSAPILHGVTAIRGSGTCRGAVLHSKCLEHFARSNDALSVLLHKPAVVSSRLFVAAKLCCKLCTQHPDLHSDPASVLTLQQQRQHISSVCAQCDNNCAVARVLPIDNFAASGVLRAAAIVVRRYVRLLRGIVPFVLLCHCTNLTLSTLGEGKDKDVSEQGTLKGFFTGETTQQKSECKTEKEHCHSQYSDEFDIGVDDDDDSFIVDDAQSSDDELHEDSKNPLTNVPSRDVTQVTHVVDMRTSYSAIYNKTSTSATIGQTVPIDDDMAHTFEAEVWQRIFELQMSPYVAKQLIIAILATPGVAVPDTRDAQGSLLSFLDSMAKPLEIERIVYASDMCECDSLPASYRTATRVASSEFFEQPEPFGTAFTFVSVHAMLEFFIKCTESNSTALMFKQSMRVSSIPVADDIRTSAAKTIECLVHIFKSQPYLLAMPVVYASAFNALKDLRVVCDTCAGEQCNG